MTTTTVVGWDTGTAARTALDWALTRPPESPLHLVRVVATAAQTFAAGSPEASARIELMEEAERVRTEHPGRAVDSELVAGDTVAELLRFARPDTLLVVGSDRPGGGGFRYTWSVGARLAGAAHGPVAVVPTGPAGGGPSGQGHEIVVGVDGSASAAAALDFAASEARRSGQELNVVCAWQEPPLWMDVHAPTPEYLHGLADMYAGILDDALDDVGRSHPEVKIRRSLTRGPAAKTLLEAAQEAQLLVVGNHGLRGVKRFLLGSVSRAVVAGTRCPVVVVPAD